MPDLSKVSRGDPVKLDAATFNTILESADDFARRRRSGAEPSPSNDPHVGATLGLVRWDGAAIPAGSVVGYGAAVIAPTDDPPAVRRRYVWIGTTPADASDPFAITIEPIPSGGYGRAAVLGQTVVDIDVTDEAHTHAVPIAGDTTKLASATSGPAVILSKPEGTGVLRCEVLIGAGSGSGDCEGNVCTDYYTSVGGGVMFLTSLSNGQSQLVWETMTALPVGEPVVIQGGILAGRPSVGINPTGEASVVYGRLVLTDASGSIAVGLSTWVPLGYYSTNSGTFWTADPPRFGGSGTFRQGVAAARRELTEQYYAAWEVRMLTNLSIPLAVLVIGGGATYIITMTGCGSCSPEAPTNPALAPPPAAPPPALVASFDHTPQSGPVALAVTFIDSTTGTPTAWAWDFGDGTGSTAQHPSHVYQTRGTYEVTLTVSNANGSSLATGTVIVFAIGTPDPVRVLKAQFRAEAETGIAPFKLVLEDLTTDGSAPLTYRVNWGDGTTSGAASSLPSTHDYDSAGSYAVTLTVVDSVGEVSAMKATVTVTAGEWGDGSLTAGIGYGPPLGGPPYTAFFVDNSSTSGGPITSWAWDFGDGGTSALQNPVSHDYAGAGTYTVRLTVTSATDADTYEQVITIP